VVLRCNFKLHPTEDHYKVTQTGKESSDCIVAIQTNCKEPDPARTTPQDWSTQRNLHHMAGIMYQKAVFLAYLWITDFLSFKTVVGLTPDFTETLVQKSIFLYKMYLISDF
jgi:hypothetical protein